MCVGGYGDYGGICSMYNVYTDENFQVTNFKNLFMTK